MSSIFSSTRPAWATTAALVILASAGAANSAWAEERQLVIDVNNFEAVGGRGNSDNISMSFNLGAYALVTGVSWDLMLTATAPSTFGDLAFVFANEGIADSPDERLQKRAIYFVPEFRNTGSGSMRSLGHLDSLPEDGLKLHTVANGVLNAQFFSQWNFDYLPATQLFKSGAITLTYEVTAVPEPETYALMLGGLAVVGAAALRRRRSAV